MVANFLCPDCDGKLDISIGAIRPMEAVAAEMLEQGVIFECPNCYRRRFDPVDITCPQCGKKNLLTDISKDIKFVGLMQKKEGLIYCTNCEFKLIVC
jgi:predicted RNA-binding Zn-ribbon protein involved in translation (DUF1610 family)